jgi:hypothetical protein
MVLLVTFWRYICIPAIVIPIVYGFRQIPSTNVFLQDPVFVSSSRSADYMELMRQSFVLAINTISPPSLPAQMDAFRSAVQFYLQYISLITAVPLSVALALSGRGITYRTEFDFMGALKSAAGGGLAGAAAMVVQVCMLMPMRTIMNYQYRYGGSIKGATTTLWQDGGFFRFALNLLVVND